jgi:hypothetical protein
LKVQGYLSDSFKNESEYSTVNIRKIVNNEYLLYPYVIKITLKGWNSKENVLIGIFVLGLFEIKFFKEEKQIIKMF